LVVLQMLQRRDGVALREVLGDHLRRSPELLGLPELDLLLRGAALEAALAVADAEGADPGLADVDRAMRELGVDADLVDDRVVAETQLERRVVLEAGAGVLDPE